MRKLAMGLLLLAITIAGIGGGMYLEAAYLNRQTVTGRVRVVGSPFIIVSPLVLDFGNMTMNTWKILFINITNAGSANANLNSTISLGNLPPATSISFGVRGVIAPRQIILSPLNLTISPAPFAGDYNFNITITASG